MSPKTINRVVPFVVLVALLTGCNHRPTATAPTDHRGGNVEWIVGVSNDQPKANIDSAGIEVAKLITATAKPGDWIHIVSLPDHLTVGSFVVPEGSARTRLRDQGVREFMPKLVAAFQPSGETGARIDLPALASTVGSIRRSDLPCRVVLFGSPIYQDPTKVGWHFNDGGAALDESIGDSDSPFGTTYQLPEGCKVVIATPGPRWGEDKPHKDAVTHFWRLYIQSLGTDCDLVRLTNAPQTAFVFDPPQFTGKEEVKHTGFGMKRFAFAAVRTKYDDDGTSVPIDGRAEDGAVGKSMDAVIREGQADASKTIVIAKWESIPAAADPNIDLDLWATVTGGSATGEISFKNPVIEGVGRLYRDVRRTGSTNPDGTPLETWEGLELEATNLDSIKLWINVYSAQAPSKVRLIRIHKGIKTERVVTINCNFGDGGQNQHHRARSAAWVQISMDKFVNSDRE